MLTTLLLLFLSAPRGHAESVCPAALSVDQVESLSEARELGFGVDVLTRESDGKAIAIIDDPRALRSPAGQALYAAFDRVGLRFDFSRPAGGRSVRPTPPAPDHHPFLRRRLRGDYVRADHFGLPDFIRRPLLWQLETEEYAPPSLINLDHRPPFWDHVARHLTALNVGLIATLAVTPVVLPADAQVGVAAVIGALLSYEVLGLTLKQWPGVREARCFETAFPLQSPRAYARARTATAQLATALADPGVNAVVLTVASPERARLLETLEGAGFSRRDDIPAAAATVPGRLGASLGVTPALIERAARNPAARAVINALGQIFDRIEDERLGPLGRALLASATLTPEERERVATSAYFRANPATLTESVALNYLAIERVLGDRLDEFAMGTLARLINRVERTSTKPTVSDTLDFGRLGRMTKLLRREEYRRAVIEIIRAHDTRPPENVRATIAELEAGTFDRRTLEHVHRLLVAAHAEPRPCRRHRSIHATFAILGVVFGTFVYDSPAPMAETQLSRVITTSARTLVENFGARVDDAPVTTSAAAEAPFVWKDLHAPTPARRKRLARVAPPAMNEPTPALPPASAPEPGPRPADDLEGDKLLEKLKAGTIEAPELRTLLRRAGATSRQPGTSHERWVLGRRRLTLATHGKDLKPFQILNAQRFLGLRDGHSN